MHHLRAHNRDGVFAVFRRHLLQTMDRFGRFGPNAGRRWPNFAKQMAKFSQSWSKLVRLSLAQIGQRCGPHGPSCAESRLPEQLLDNVRATFLVSWGSPRSPGVTFGNMWRETFPQLSSNFTLAAILGLSTDAAIESPVHPAEGGRHNWSPVQRIGTRPDLGQLRPTSPKYGGVRDKFGQSWAEFHRNRTNIGRTCPISVESGQTLTRLEPISVEVARIGPTSCRSWPRSDPVRSTSPKCSRIRFKVG